MTYHVSRRTTRSTVLTGDTRTRTGLIVRPTLGKPVSESRPGPSSVVETAIHSRGWRRDTPLFPPEGWNQPKGMFDPDMNSQRREARQGGSELPGRKALCRTGVPASGSPRLNLLQGVHPCKYNSRHGSSIPTHPSVMRGG